MGNPNRGCKSLPPRPTEGLGDLPAWAVNLCGRSGATGKISHSCSGSQPPERRRDQWQEADKPGKGWAGETRVGGRAKPKWEGGIDHHKVGFLTVATPAPMVAAPCMMTSPYQSDQNPKQRYCYWLGTGVSTG